MSLMMVLCDRYTMVIVLFFFSSRRRHTRYWRDWSSDVCSSDLPGISVVAPADYRQARSALLATWDLPGPIYYRLGKDDKTRSEERRVGKGVDLGGRRIIKKKKTTVII